MRTLLLLTLLSTNILADNWPQWRGPKNDGHSTETKLPAEWAPDKNVKWKLPMPGPGSSTPCVWNLKIFLTSMDGDEVVLLCIDTFGKETWRKPLGKGNVKTMRDEGGNLASASCSTDGLNVYTFAGNGTLAAFDFKGEEKWSLNLAAKYGDLMSSSVIQFGAHWTPVLDRQSRKLYMTVMHRKAQRILQVDGVSGKIDWDVERKSDSPAGVESPDVYASPFIWEQGEQKLLIVHGNDYCTAHKLKNGSEVWRVSGLNPKSSYNRAWRAVSSPLVTPDLIVVPSCKSGVTVAIDPLKAKGTIDAGNAAEKWRIPKNTPDVPSPIRVDDLIFLMGERGVLYCYDSATGKLNYETRITDMRHRANPVYADGKLYLMGRDGTTVVVKPGKTFERVAVNKLPDSFTGSPAISNGVIYLRGWKDLYAIAAP